MSLPVLHQNIPEALTSLPRWVLWKNDIIDGKSRKTPYNVRGNRKAQSNNPATWNVFGLAMTKHVTGWEGIGFVFDDSDDIFGGDLDGCRNPDTSEVADWAAKIVADFNTYTEVSPSGTGLKFFARGKLPEGARNKWKVNAPAMGGKTAGVEIYDKLRYFAVTGHRLPDVSANVEERQAQLDALLASHKPKPQPPRVQGPPQSTSIIDRAAKYVAKMPGAVSGEHGHDVTFHVACVLKNGFSLSADEAMPIFEAWNQTCAPPWSEAELLRKLNEADKQSGERGYLINSDRNGAAGHASHSTNSKPVESPKLRPEVHLPSGGVEIRETAAALGELLAGTDRFFLRGGSPMQLASDEGEPVLWTVKPSELCSDFETVARLKIWKAGGEGPESVDSRCSKATAELILESQAFRAALPEIKVVSRCPVLVERGGQLVQVCGYDRTSGIWAVGSEVPEISVDEAKRLIDELLQDFNFATAGDAARARAALITPAMTMSGLLRGRAPIDLGEADDSQSGKGYRCRLVAAIYGVTIRSVAQRQRGGVGSLQESFDKALERGASFICLDNIRGRIDLPALESFLTEPIYLARTPYGRGVEIDATRIVTMFTSNKADITTDFANRSSLTRILKRPDDHKFAVFPEGDIYDRVSANPSRYLAAVFAVVHEWHRRGKPEAHVTGHDFRRWARVLGYITQEILGTAPLLEGHRAAQQRMASPALNWLRAVCIAVRNAGQLSVPMRAHQVLTIALGADIETPGVPGDAGLEDDEQWAKASRAVGRQLAKCVKGDSIPIDAFTVTRQKLTDKDYREVTNYAFSSRPPNTPESPPNQNAETPNPPNQCGSVLARENSICSVSVTSIAGLRGSGVATETDADGDWGQV